MHVTKEEELEEGPMLQKKRRRLERKTKANNYTTFQGMEEKL